MLEELLRYMEARALLQKIKTGSCPLASLASLETLTLERRLSEAATAHRLLHPALSAFEFKLMVTHLIAYPSFDLKDRHLFPKDPYADVAQATNDRASSNQRAVYLELSNTAQSTVSSRSQEPFGQAEASAET